MKQFARLTVVLCAMGLAGCPDLGSGDPPVGDVPDQPTWDEHILPIMNKYCNECHSVPATQSAPGTMRFDTCETTDGVPGAKSQARRLVVRTVDQSPSPMPPSSYGSFPTPDEMEMLSRWVANGSPCEGGGTVPPDAGGDAGFNNGPPDLGNNGVPDMTVEPWVYSQIAPFLRSTCGGNGCHAGDGQGNFGNLDGDNATIQATLQGSDAAGNPYVSGGDRAGSVIYQRMTTSMPPGRLQETAAEKIGLWIDNGADYSQ